MRRAFALRWKLGLLVPECGLQLVLGQAGDTFKIGPVDPCLVKSGVRQGRFR